MGLEPDEHYEAAWAVAGEKKFPMDDANVVPLDLRCAADMMARSYANLHEARSIGTGH